MRRKLFITLLGIVIIFTTLIIKAFCTDKGMLVSVVGDILLDRGVKESIQRFGPAYPYKKISNVLKSSDITLGNLECPITSNGAPILKKSNLIFRGNPSNIPSLLSGGFKLLNLANNHVMDYGRKGLSDTLELLNSSGIKTFGAGINQETAAKPLYIHKNGLTIGFLGFSAFPPEGYFYFENKLDTAHLDESKLAKTIKNAKKCCDILVVMFHWGKEFNYYPGEHQRLVAHMACDAGADIVIGSHPHVLQGIEKYKSKFIFYSLGNFIFDRQAPRGTNETGILQFLAVKNKIQNIIFLPVIINNSQPSLCDSGTSQYIINRLKLYSKGLGTVIEFKDNKGLIH